MTTRPDVTVADHGTLWGFTLNTDAAREWVDEHIPDDAQWLGRNTFFAEHRYAPAIAEGMAADGLELEE